MAKRHHHGSVSSHVVMIVANVLLPNWCQAISNYHADSHMTGVYMLLEPIMQQTCLSHHKPPVDFSCV